ncbi:MAG: phosphatase PAP2 family protein [Candidatus Kapabacteria bacterium]|nr:phosphatase PAP2 family protein [Candidatus Kapabacteria bacterium]
MLDNFIGLIVSFDKSAFYFINVTLANSITDFIMPIITNEHYWMPVYVLLFVYLLIFSGKKGRIVALGLAVTIIITDQFCSSFLKQAVGRLRPCFTLNNIHLLVSCGPGKSFPSSHAANNFAAAVFLLNYYSKQKYIFIIIASLVALSRVFVGVHYPLDIMAGALIGALIAYIVVFSIKKIFKL